MAQSFVGRDPELALLREMLERARLVTLLGIGGIGKSRLVREHLARSPHPSVIACDLTTARTVEEICTELAGALGAGLDVAGAPRRRVEALCRALTARAPSPLVVLEGAEAVARELAPLVDQWLAAAPDARFLVTSRVRLGAANEHVIAVEPLSVDGDGAPSDAERLFLDRARAAGARLGEGDAGTVRELVRALEGIPLAIEVVAARARLLPVAGLVARIREGKDVGAAADRRHAAMRNVIAESWELLDDEARAALLACACFRGGFSLDSAEAMLGPRALELLERLMDASLLRSVPPSDDSPRFDLFQTVRSYAAERAHERPDEERARFLKHAEHMAESAAAWRAAARSTGGPAYLARLAREHDNLAAALARLVDAAPLQPAEARTALRLAVELEPIRMLRGHAATYLEWLRAVRAAAQGDDASVELRALRLAALLCEARTLAELGRVDESRSTFECALELAQGDGDASREGHARCGLARLDAHAGEWARALEGIAAAKVCAVRARDDALLHLCLASDSFYGSELRDAEEQLRPLERAAAHFREAGDEREALFWATQLARAHVDFDRQDKAHASLTESIGRARAIGDRRMEGFASFGLGGVHLSRGELEDAAASYALATEILREVGKERDRAYALGYLGVVEQLRGRFDAADAAYTEACEALSSVADAPNALLFSLFRAALAADLDRPTDAGAQFARTEEDVARWAGSGMRPVVAQVLTASLEASRARLAWSARDLDGFARHRRAAERCVGAADARPTQIIAAREVYTWRDVSLDVRAAVRLATRAVGALPPLRLPADCLVVVGDCARIRARAGSAWIDLTSREVLRRLVAKLVAERLERPGAPAPASVLIEAAWPGELLTPTSAANRLHVSLGTLRRLGLEPILERTQKGWRLRADCPVLRLTEDEAEPPPDTE